jgi:uncharacterized membrane protein
MDSNWRYYLSRIMVVALISLIFAWSGLVWWLAVLVFVVGAGFFIWAPVSGRYRVVDNQTATPLRLDERSQRIRNRAGRIAFLVVEFLALAIFTLGQFQDPPQIPTSAVGAMLGVGMISYLMLIWVLERAPQPD